MTKGLHYRNTKNAPHIPFYGPYAIVLTPCSSDMEAECQEDCTLYWKRVLQYFLGFIVTCVQLCPPLSICVHLCPTVLSLYRTELMTALHPRPLSNLHGPLACSLFTKTHHNSHWKRSPAFLQTTDKKHFDWTIWTIQRGIDQIEIVTMLLSRLLLVHCLECV